ncbi:cytochrome c biogenesis protein CcsA [Bacillus thermotolerans]|uniref:cytochrome c biogenesis protein CcsA n=1 Tax=Bacillus thermotolerans TaxID=1221996 RepID=UPI00057C4FC5|nr:cytochrome c biogenesis protein CcsA [Bacillus thermotolerans]KKB35110.1 HemX protein, negative effector of steady-state concentration of glutamyl-tRNA reductase [Bacillus thermotolerans]KKB43489.1 HemX protein, negative effector of steady-state concentration of glutamyl-tRNA reductase [Bacillus thermotolerans]
MFEQGMTRIHELMIILYALAIMLYFIDFLNQNRKANKIAFSILSIVWALQTIFLFLYMLETRRFPVLTLFEGLYFYAWVLITFSLVINRLLRMDFTVFFVNVIGFSIMAIHTFTPVQIESEAMAERLISELLLIHITMAILSYAAFSFSFIFSLLYLLQHRLLKMKKWNQRLWRLGDLEKLERFSYVFNAVGVPMLLLSLILGLIWKVITLPDVSWFDVKIVASFILLIIYGVYLYLKIRREMYGKPLALLNTAAFLVLFINFFLVSRFSSFHFWYS